MLTKLALRPGIVRDVSKYSNSGGWADCDKIRFRNGLPESMGGWAKALAAQFLGICRSINTVVSLTGVIYHGLGTNLKFYMRAGGTIADVTPIRSDVTLGTDPFTTNAAGSAIIDVSHTSHGAVLNDFVTYSGTTGPIDGIPASEFNIEHQVTAVTDTDNYQITVVTTATAGSVSGGGASVDAEYQINTGGSISESSLGWGADGWGEGGWGEAATTTFFIAEARVWSQALFS